ncbi:MAG: hypothetical protein A3A27_02425 [Candidatus Wildermuthbacteria bacterium RIFCSPLOWO2_01_FULL_47_18]|uniref:Uncharacterized protein n=1 Tax=Candidatus Wildermuthbacteria bacterium RIFCSPLOWO2_01_FULL_47_18 TaxID=1802460 RepID=A0A1G2RK07_9BACT|nr:MAG: hypothetical protein A3A27_02425 [Candidatus Wildermuthbacteria bacterium RIFCSPLOWO2_01_FULL_47_18]
MKKQKQLPAPPVQGLPDKQAEKPVLQKYTPEETKNKVLELFRAQGDVNQVLYELGSDLLPKFLHGTKKEQRDVRKALDGQVMSVMYGFEADTHVALMEGFPERLRGSAREICTQFIRDFDCKTDADKILAESAAIAFMRYLDSSRRLNGCMDIVEYISDERTRYLGYLSKQMDRAHRQYLSALMTLKQLKAPAIEMNIKTKNTFVAQNQQINATQPTESNKNETIDPK